MGAPGSGTKSLWDYRDYKAYLIDFIEHHKGSGRGTRSALARAAGCQTGYVTQVLSGEAQFSLEQTDRINGFCMHADEEAEYFVLLVQFARAGTPSLRKMFQRQINRRVEEQTSIRKRVMASETLGEAQQMIYFSTWEYAAIHALLTVPEFRTKEKIEEHLRIGAERVARTLEFLEQCGLATRKGVEYLPGTRRIHLDPDSPMLVRHHANVRLLALQSLNRDLREDMHYSSVLTLSEDDVARLKKKLSDFVVETKALIRESNPIEGLHALSIDFLRLGGS